MPSLRAAFLLLFLPSAAAADFAGLPQSGTRSVAYASGGFSDDTPTLTLGYAYDVADEQVECPTTVFLATRIEIPEGGSVHATTISAGMRFTLLAHHAFWLPLQAALALRTDLYDEDLHIALRTSAAALPGYYGRDVSVAAELMLVSTWGRFSTKLGGNGEHQFTRGAHRFGFGVRVARVIAARIELVGRVGYEDATHIAGPAPTYADVSVGVRF